MVKRMLDSFIIMCLIIGAYLAATGFTQPEHNPAPIPPPPVAPVNPTPQPVAPASETESI